MNTVKSQALKALIFDVDGTLADTESAHLAAFNQAFEELQLGWHWDVDLYTQLLEISGGKERILYYWQKVQPALISLNSRAVQDTVARIHVRKTAYYGQRINDGDVRLRQGVLELILDAKAAGIEMAIATTTSPVNVSALLRRALGPDWRLNFSAIGDASTAPLKKPHPQVYLQMLKAMRLDARQCLAFEDSANGLQAANAAGLATVVTPTAFTAHHEFTNALRVFADLSQVSLAQLTEMHACIPVATRKDQR